MPKGTRWPYQYDKRTLIEKHSDGCLFVYINKNVKSRMIAIHYLRKHPNESVGDFIKKIHEEQRES